MESHLARLPSSGIASDLEWSPAQRQDAPYIGVACVGDDEIRIFDRRGAGERDAEFLV